MSSRISLRSSLTPSLAILVGLALSSTAAVAAEPVPAAAPAVAPAEDQPPVAPAPVSPVRWRPHVHVGVTAGLNDMNLDDHPFSVWGTHIDTRPVAFELGIVPERNVELALEVMYAESVGSRCDNRCGTHRLRVGFIGRGHLFPKAVVDPWVGAGIGFERFTVPAGITGTDPERTFNGLDLLRMQAGLDLHLVPGTSMGPYAEGAYVFYSPTGPAWLALSQPLQLGAGLRLAFAL